MAGDDRRRVKSGETLAIPATVWNDLLSMLEWWQRRRDELLRPVAVQDFFGAALHVRNDTGQSLDQFAIVYPREPLAFPAGADPPSVQDAALRQFWRPGSVRMTAATPVPGRPFAVVQDAIPAPNSPVLVRAIIAGVTPVRIQVTVDNQNFCAAEPLAGNVQYLTLSERGSATVLWREMPPPAALPKVVWAVVLLHSAYVSTGEFDADECELILHKVC